VRVAPPEEITTFGEYWMARAQQLAAELALPCKLDVASDPFFGRVGQIMAVSQRQQALKFELLIPYHEGAVPTACMSLNYHRDHFGAVWHLADAAGERSHTSCFAFGVDRLTIALFCVHGVDVPGWPQGVRRALAI
jgi:seryl-tRNA synthetase